MEKKTQRYHKVTADILVEVVPNFDIERSRPDRKMYVFSYFVTIHNLGQSPCQVLKRRWKITDANGRVRQLFGEGVVGKTPVIHPMGYFQYTSWVELETEVGSMEGDYYIQNLDSGEFLFVRIPLFALDSPVLLH